MRRFALCLVSALLVASSVVGCGKSTPSRSSTAPTVAPAPARTFDSTFVVLHGGARYCGYITEETLDVMCGNSGVGPDNQISPEPGETFDTGDGVDADDRMVAFLVCGNLIKKLPPDLQNDPGIQELWGSWTGANGVTACNGYDAWIAAGEPNSKSTHKLKKPKPSASRTAKPSPTLAPTTSPTPRPSCTKRPASRCSTRR